MKVMGFMHREEIYKSAKEGHCPILLGFVRKCKIMVIKDMGPDHWKRSRLCKTLGDSTEIKHADKP
jgi:hypothetical protein